MLDDVSYKANVDSDDNDTCLASVNIPAKDFLNTQSRGIDN